MIIEPLKVPCVALSLSLAAPDSFPRLFQLALEFLSSRSQNVISPSDVLPLSPIETFSGDTCSGRRRLGPLASHADAVITLIPDLGVKSETDLPRM